jgi:hypothetical protein
MLPVETAEGAKEPTKADITEVCQDMFSKMATLLDWGTDSHK